MVQGVLGDGALGAPTATSVPCKPAGSRRAILTHRNVQLAPSSQAPLSEAPKRSGTACVPPASEGEHVHLQGKGGQAP